ncbi:MAG: hypothetical protein E6Q83_04410 [Thiothrix sp.]|nr:MAG: hypothetical protein E6Q83_04410 [Thiothrix sp.]
MSKFILGLSFILGTSAVWAQGSYPYPSYPTPNWPIQSVPNAGASYYPALPYGSPVYPYGMQTNPLSPYPFYPYAAYPSMQPPMNLGVPNPASVQSYPYTSPYDANQPARPGPKPAPAPQAKTETKPWGDTRYIWPDFYTDQTSDMWDKMINAPHDLGYMPGGWRFPSFSSPDPVTVGDAVANQVPPIVEEVPNFMNFTN